MNANEPLTLSKMAVTVLLVVLVASGAMGLYFYLNDETLKFTREMEHAPMGAETQRFNDLENDSKSNTEGILVTNVCSALSDSSDTGLMYIAVILPPEDGNAKIVYTYDYFDTSGIVDADTSVETSRTPATLAIKGLMKYSGYMCNMEVVRTDNSGLDLTGVIVRIRKKV